jgi:hypothetical protein
VDWGCGTVLERLVIQDAVPVGNMVNVLTNIRVGQSAFRDDRTVYSRLSVM